MVISNKPLKFILVALVAMLPYVSFANSTEEKEATPTESTDVKSEIKEFINHHLLDAHDFTFNADKESGEHWSRRAWNCLYAACPVRVLSLSFSSSLSFLGSFCFTLNKKDSSLPSLYLIINSLFLRTSILGNLELK